MTRGWNPGTDTDLRQNGELLILCGGIRRLRGKISLRRSSGHRGRTTGDPHRPRTGPPMRVDNEAEPRRQFRRLIGLFRNKFHPE